MFARASVEFPENCIAENLARTSSENQVVIFRGKSGKREDCTESGFDVLGLTAEFTCSSKSGTVEQIWRGSRFTPNRAMAGECILGTHLGEIHPGLSSLGSSKHKFMEKRKFCIIIIPVISAFHAPFQRESGSYPNLLQEALYPI